MIIVWRIADMLSTTTRSMTRSSSTMRESSQPFQRSHPLWTIARYRTWPSVQMTLVSSACRRPSPRSMVRWRTRSRTRMDSRMALLYGMCAKAVCE